uniref:ferrochelatase n=1 Tax=Prevotella heparinolytica TaxID=28113 RepID=UPI0035A05FD8
MTDITTSHTAILLVNTGSPESLEIKDVRAYLRRFLSDKRIIGLAAPLRYTLVYGLIAPGRAKLAREKNEKVWSPEGFILQVLSHRLVKRMEERSGITV